MATVAEGVDLAAAGVDGLARPARRLSMAELTPRMEGACSAPIRLVLSPMIPTCAHAH